MSVSLFAQRYSDLRVDSIVEPSRMDTYEDGVAIKTNWPIYVIVTNLGPNTIEVGDTMVWAASVTDIETNQVKVSVPGGGKVYAWVATKAIAANDTVHLNQKLTLTGGMQYSRNVRMAVLVSAYSAKDTITSNNTLTRDIVWYDLHGWNVSINDPQFFNNINVTPNPANGEMVITLLEVNFTSAKVELYDISGNLVHSSDEQMLGNSYIINTTEFANGMYILKVTDGDRVSSCRVSINH